MCSVLLHFAQHPCRAPRWVRDGSGLYWAIGSFAWLNGHFAENRLPADACISLTQCSISSAAVDSLRILAMRASSQYAAKYEIRFNRLFRHPPDMRRRRGAL